MFLAIGDKVIHGYIQPANIFFKENELRLMYFGMRQLLDFYLDNMINLATSVKLSYYDSPETMKE